MVLPRVGFRPRVLSPEGLEHIATHQYKPGKYTPLDSLLNPSWTRMAEALPTWLAPNLVTLFGFLPLVATFGFTWKTSPYFDLAPPRWLALTTTATLFFYQTLDALDGKQARRTGSSTPLGQLFDHGCDCMTCISQHSAGAMVLLPGPESIGMFGLAALQSGFFMAQWQEYHTGVLRTSFGPVGVTETQFTLMALALGAGVVGPDVVQEKMVSLVQPPWASTPLPLGHLCTQGWIMFCGVLGVICGSKTVAHVAKEKGTAGLLGAVSNLVPVVALNSLQALWDPSFYASAPREICLFTGVHFFFYTAQMILFSMARMPFPTFQPTLLVYASLVGLSRGWPLRLPVPTYSLLLAASACTGCWVTLWLYSVVEELKEKLGIQAFSLQKKKLQ